MNENNVSGAAKQLLVASATKTLPKKNNKKKLTKHLDNIKGKESGIH